jgi:transposase-like protein
MPDQRKKALQRLESGESRAAVARSYGVSKATVYRMVRSACPSGGLLEAGLVMQVTDARTASQSLTLENATKAIPAFSGILADSRLRES